MNHTHTIQLHSDRHVVSGLTIHETHEGQRDKFNVLQSAGGVEFVTQKGKRFFVHFNEFSFIVNPTPATLRLAA